MRNALRAAFAAWLLTLALPAGAAVTAWTTDPTLAVRTFSASGVPRIVPGTAVYWNPETGTDDSPPLTVSPGSVARCTWDANDASATPDVGTTLNVYQSAVPDSGAVATLVPYVQVMTDGVFCPPSDPATAWCSTVDLHAGTYVFRASALDTSALLSCRGL